MLCSSGPSASLEVRGSGSSSSSIGGGGPLLASVGIGRSLARDLLDMLDPLTSTSGY